MKRNFTIIGPFHSIQVKIRSSRTLKKAWGKNERVYGLYLPEDNTILIADDNTPDQMLHALMHEIVHAIEDQMSNMEEEGKAEVLGSYLIRLFNVKSIKEILTWA